MFVEMRILEDKDSIFHERPLYGLSPNFYRYEYMRSLREYLHRYFILF